MDRLLRRRLAERHGRAAVLALLAAAGLVMGTAHDARGRSLAAGPTQPTAGVADEVPLVGAVEPLALTAWAQGGRLIAPHGNASDNFGYSVALSADGRFALVGSPLAAVGSAPYRGVAHVFVRSGSRWAHQAMLTAPGGEAGDLFGRSVSLASDGSYALVGASGRAVGGVAGAGSVFVFARSGSLWSRQAQLVATGAAANDEFGYAVSLSADGGIALVGLPGVHPAASGASPSSLREGTAYVFARSGSRWLRQARLTGRGGIKGDWFGAAVSLSPDGRYALVGAPQDGGGSLSSVGAAYVFARSGNRWSRQAQLAGPGGTGADWFGWSVSLSADGRRALVGVPHDEAGGLQQGSAHVFARSGSRWSQQARLLAAAGAERDEFGIAVSLSADGRYALVGAPVDNVRVGDEGSVTVFEHSGGAWPRRAWLTAPDAAENDMFGAAVSVSSDGRTALVGVVVDDVGANADQGSVVVFTRSGSG